eukprot:jgi/Mesvir1/2019/Mv06199-RA.1
MRPIPGWTPQLLLRASTVVIRDVRTCSNRTPKWQPIRLHPTSWNVGARHAHCTCAKDRTKYHSGSRRATVSEQTKDMAMAAVSNAMQAPVVVPSGCLVAPKLRGRGLSDVLDMRGNFDCKKCRPVRPCPRPGATRKTRGVVTASASGNGPKKVGIVGGGIAGLCLAYSLLHLPTGVEEVALFERAPQLRLKMGGGLNLNGGSVVLQRLGLGHLLTQCGNELHGVFARGVSGKTLFEVDMDKACRQVPGAHELRDPATGQVLSYTVMRDGLQMGLADSLPKRTLRLGKELVDLELKNPGGEGGGVTCFFTDGSSESFDLFVGCDGIKSIVRRKVLAGTTQTKPRYSGIVMQYGVTAPLSPPQGAGAPGGAGHRPPGSTNTAHQWFGDGAYALSYTGGGVGAKQDMVVLCRQEKEEKAPGTDMEKMRTDVLSRLERKKMPQDLINLASVCERFFEVIVYDHEPAATWNMGGCVTIMGDAAHAMTPFIGQGANQAMQDAYSLALKLVDLNSGKFRSLGEALTAYETVRKNPNAIIMECSRLLGLVETLSGVGAVGRDCALYASGKLGLGGMIFIGGALLRL